MSQQPPKPVEIRFHLKRPVHTSNVAGGTEVPSPVGRVSRLAERLALAIYFEEMVRTGEAIDYADIARLGCISRERVSQIVALRWLAPDIQGAILDPSEGRHPPCSEVQARRIARTASWPEQRKRWRALQSAGKRIDTGANVEMA
jgi:hypothetical protein